MNRIKYSNGMKSAAVKIAQPSYSAICARFNRWSGGHTLPTMAQADRYMASQGYERSGLRHKPGTGWSGGAGKPRATKPTRWYNFAALYRKRRAEKRAAA